MAITPQPGWQVDPNNPNGVIRSSTPDSTVAPAPVREPAPFIGPPKPPAREPAVVSTNTARDAVQTSITKLNDYNANAANTTAQKAATSATAQPVEPTTFIDPTTLQKYTVGDASINRDLVQSYLDKGYSVESGQLPSGMRTPVDPNADPATNAAQKASDDAQKQLETLSGQLDSVSNLTPAQQQMIASIKNMFETRKTQMADANMRGVASTNAFGIASGASRGSASFDGIVSAQERDGIAKLAELDSQEQQAIAEAQNAYSQDNLRLLTTKISAAQDIADRKQKTLSEINAAALAANKAQQDRLNKVADDDKKAQADLTKQIGDIAQEAQKNGAAPDIVQAINAAPDVATALDAAGSSLQTGTGIVGEYVFYKNQAIAAGQTPIDFNAYQNIDANRKAKVAAAGAANGLNNTTLSKVTSIAGQLDSEQAIKSYQTIAQSLEAVKNSGTSPADDIQRIYAFAKIMDPNSAVREGEYKTIQDYAQATFPSYGIKAQRLFTNTGFLTPEARTIMLATLQTRADAAKSSYDSIRSSYASRINKITGSNDGADYLTDYSQPTTGADLVRQEDEAKQNVIDYGKTHPDAQAHIKALVSSPQPENNNKPYTYAEAMQILGITGPQAVATPANTAWKAPTNAFAF